VTSEHFGDACVFEGDAAPFAQIGYTLVVLRPGEPSALYHREANQEDFLVVAGECLLLVEREERPLRRGAAAYPAGPEDSWSRQRLIALSRWTSRSSRAAIRSSALRAWRARRKSMPVRCKAVSSGAE
jgi:hypothetical protein